MGGSQRDNDSSPNLSFNDLKQKEIEIKEGSARVLWYETQLLIGQPNGGSPKFQGGSPKLIFFFFSQTYSLVYCSLSRVLTLHALRVLALQESPSIHPLRCYPICDRIFFFFFSYFTINYTLTPGKTQPV